MSQLLQNLTSINDNICVLVSETNPEHKFVLLDKEPFIMGRSELTGIIDQRLSKKQSKQIIFINCWHYILVSHRFIFSLS